MIFPYLPLPTRSPVPSLGGAMVRYRPVISVRLFGPLGSRLYDGCLDCASDDTIFPIWLAHRLGIDLQGAPSGQAHPIGGTIVPYLYSAVTLRISDGVESFEWQATVGFVNLALRWALLGHAGFLEFFDTQLLGGRRQVILTPNHLFPGTRISHSLPSP